MRASRIVAAGFLFLCLETSASPSHAQTGNQASIDGVARDSLGGPIAAARVVAVGEDGGVAYETRTNEEGLFRFPALPVGTYRVLAECEGFATLAFEAIELEVGARITLPLHFHIAAQSADVTVQGEAPLVETSRTGVSATVDSRSIATLPVNGRDFTSFTLLLPGVMTDVRGGLSFGGQRAMNSLLVDGVSSDDSFWGQPIGGEGFQVLPGQSGYHVSLEAVQEFQVNANAYSAELGRAGGGVINSITKSGTDEFHGSVFEFYRDRSLNATSSVNKSFGLPKDAFHFHQFGGVVGGPIVRRTASFFVSYDGLRSVIANGVSLNIPAGFQPSPDPATAAFQERAVNYLTERSASWSFPFRQDDWLARADWRLTRAHSVNVRWLHQGADAAFSGLPQQSRENAVPVEGPTKSAAASLTSAWRSSVVNVARVAYVSHDSAFLGVAATPQADVFEQGQRVLTVGRRPGTPQEMSSRRVQWTDTLSWLRGAHAFKAGLDILLDDLTYFNAQNFAGSYRFVSLASFGESLARTPHPRPGETFLQAFSGLGTPGITTRPDTNEYAAFVLDEWRIHPAVTLNLGMRYDVQVMQKPPVKNPSPELAAAHLDTSRRPIDSTNVAPRIGVAWLPSRSHTFVARAGFGTFYAPTISALASRAHFLNGVSVQPRLLQGGTPDAALIPAYPNTFCGPPDPDGVPPSCAPPSAGASAPLLMLFSPTYRQPRTHQASAGIEFAAGREITVAVNYVFVKGTHLPWVRDINLAGPAAAATIGVADTSTLLTYNRYLSPRPLAGFDRVSIFDSGADSVFHGLTVQVNRRFAQGFQVLASYTLGKTTDDKPDAYAINPGGTDSQLLSDPLDPASDRGASANDQRHRVVLSGVWHPMASAALPGAARMLLNDWTVAGILTAESGRPYSGLVNFDLNNDGNDQTDRTPGTARNTFYLPSLVSLDLRLARSIGAGPHAHVQLIAEGFNLLNHANVTGVSDTQYAVLDSAAACGIAATPCLVPQDAGPGAFGRPTATAGPRILQLGLRVTF